MSREPRSFVSVPRRRARDCRARQNVGIGSTPIRMVQHRERALVQQEVVIVTVSQAQLLIVLVDPGADPGWPSKIEGSTGDAADPSVGINPRPTGVNRSASLLTM